MKHNLRYYFLKAQKEGWAMGQFNFSTAEQLKGIVLAAREMESPIIVATSEGENEFLGKRQTISLVRAYQEDTKLPIFLNLDHGKNLGYVKRVADLGYDCVHFDGSNIPFAENLKLAREISDYCHRKGVLVEGEFNNIGGASELHENEAVSESLILTKPEEAEKFVKETRVDSLALSIGNVHGVYETMPVLHPEIVQEVRLKTKAFLVLHGGSGFKEEAIESVISSGICKVNINTEIRIAWRQAIEKGLASLNEFKPYKILDPAVLEIKKTVEQKIKMFNSYSKI